MIDLSGRVVVVTGGGRGLGRAFAETAARAGARVAIPELVEELGQKTEAELRAEGLDVTYLPLDLGDPVSVEGLTALLADRFDRVDSLINNAAIATGIGGKTFEHLDIDTWDRVMRVNVRGTWLAIKAMVPLLRRSEKGGRILNIASDTALWGAPNLLHYVSSKGAVISMTRALARELGPDAITCNAIAPGLVRVEATEYVPRERHQLYETGRAIQRPQFPEDVVAAAMYFISDGAGFVTGQVLPVNGGFVFN